MAYSYDLRLRIYNYSSTHTIRNTAEYFSVSPNTVVLYRKLFKETGNLEPRYYSHIYHYLVTAEGEAFIQKLLAEEANLTLNEIRYRYENVFGILISVGAMFNTLNRLDFSRKKKTFSAPLKCTARRMR